MNNYPVAVFCYKRLDHLKRTLEALARNHGAAQTDLIIFSDAARFDYEKADIEKVRRYLETLTGFKSVTLNKHKQNKGLRRSITDGVTEVCRDFGAAIVLEDDIETAPYFLTYMNECLEHYADTKEVLAVSGFSYIDRKVEGTYFIFQPLCWGWATWKDRWDEYETATFSEFDLSKDEIARFNYGGGFNFYKQYELNKSGRLSSWYIFWYLHAFVTRRVTIYPNRSLCRNLGFDGSGTNSGKSVDYNSSIYGGRIPVQKVQALPDNEAYLQIERRLKRLKPSIPQRIFNRLSKFV